MNEIIFTPSFNDNKSLFFYKTNLLEKDDLDSMAPICYPLVLDDKDLSNKIIKWFESRNIFLGIYNFDVNRNMFDPSYKKSIPLPLYQGIDISLYEEFLLDFPQLDK